MKRYPINVRVPQDLLDRMPPPSQEAPHVAEANGTGRGAWIVQAIREKLERDERLQDGATCGSMPSKLGE